MGVGTWVAIILGEVFFLFSGVGRCNIAGGLKDTLGLEDRALAYDCALVNALSAHACQL